MQASILANTVGGLQLKSPCDERDHLTQLKQCE